VCAEIENIPNGFEILTDGSRELRLINENLARSVLFEELIRFGAIFAPAFMAKLDGLWVIGEGAKRIFDALDILRGAMKSGRILHEQNAELPCIGQWL
jgi:hypothetical protein